jgi:hypothetical protein
LGRERITPQRKCVGDSIEKGIYTLYFRGYRAGLNAHPKNRGEGQGEIATSKSLNKNRKGGFEVQRVLDNPPR